MAYSRAESLTCLLLPSCLVYLSLVSSAFSEPLISSSLASTQIKFWSENVHNKMPDSIFAKLSPLTEHDYAYYSEMISQNNFVADTKFCSLAKLFCQGGVLVDWCIGYQNKFTVDATAPHEDVHPFSFFRLSSLKEGNIIHLPNMKNALPNRAFLPPQITEKIILRAGGIKKIFPKFSEEATNRTLSICDAAAAVKGERRGCSKSLEEMVNFAQTILGKKSKLIALASKSTSGSRTQLLIKNVKKFDAENVVSCHETFLPFATYLCHSLSHTKVYSMDLLEPKTGAPMNTVIAICHMDTSAWSAKHAAFQVLRFGPGQGEACHFLHEGVLAWIAGGENI